jgi:CSLREA domain-containing protein
MAATEGQRSLRALRGRTRRLVVVLALALTAALVAVPIASAADPVYTVDSTADDSDATAGDGTCETAATECTLRAAIEELNAGAVPGSIEFDIPTAIPLDDVAVIQPATSLPALDVPVVVDGYTQPGAAEATNTGVAQIRVFLNGTTVRTVSPDDDGLVIAGSDAGSTVQGLAIGLFGGAALSLGSNGNQVRGNFLGLLPDGSTPARNRGGGVRIDGVTDNVIGGDADGDRNVIAANFTDPGVLDDSGSKNVIAGNVIGLDATGKARTGGGVSAGGNLNGIVLTSAGEDRIESNVISGNGADGIDITGGGSHTIRDNHVGLDVTGEDQFGNGLTGINIDTSSFNVIGGTAESDRNVISANSDKGLLITSANSLSNEVLNNYVGSDAAGNSNSLPGVNPGDTERPFGNRGQGIEIRNAKGTIVGAPGAGNAVGLNGFTAHAEGAGIAVYGLDAIDTKIQANLVGLSPQGIEHMGNGGSGIRVESARNTIVGGAGAGEGNIIVDSGFGLRCCSGITFAGAGVTVVAASGTRIKGNRIGTSPGAFGSDTIVYPNLGEGVSLHNTSDTVIGGIEPGAGNQISNNERFGVLVDGAGTVKTRIQGNLIGTTHDGKGRLGNGACGIVIADATRDTVVGGDEPQARNVISANATDGIEAGNGVRDLVVAGNVIGLETDGVYQLPNGGRGILSGADGAQIRDNLVSGNGLGGIEVYPDAVDNVIRSNAIGVNATSDSAIANNGRGIEVLAGAQRTIIGGDRVDDGNLVSGNAGAGVVVGADETQVLGNRIGTDKTGERPIPNRAGVSVAAADVKVGSLQDGKGNVVAFNNDTGVTVLTTGTDAEIAGNVLSGNGANGLKDMGQGTRAIGNFIGSDRVGGRWFGNHDAGVLLGGGNATIGTSAPGERNRIAFNGSSGVLVLANSAGNRIEGNSIDDNATLGIDLTTAGPGGPADPVFGVTPNDDLDADTGANALQNFPELASARSGPGGTEITGVLRSAPNASFTVDVYAGPAADDLGYGEGADHLGTQAVTTDGSGVAQLSLTIGRAVQGVVSATATSRAGDTSELSRAIPITYTQARPLADIRTTTASPTSATTARIAGTVMPADAPTTVFAEYAASGSPTCEGAGTSGLQRTAPQALPDTEDRARAVALALTGLSGSTSYCVRLAADSPAGTVRGDFVPFTTNAAAAPVPPPTPPGPTDKRVVATLMGALAVSGKAGEMDAILGGGGYATRFGAPAAGRILIEWFATPRGAKKQVLIAQGRGTASGAGRIVVFVKLTSAGKRVLRAARKPLKVTAKATFTMAGRKAITTTRRLELRP